MQTWNMMQKAMPCIEPSLVSPSETGVRTLISQFHPWISRAG